MSCVIPQSGGLEQQDHPAFRDRPPSRQLQHQILSNGSIMAGIMSLSEPMLSMMVSINKLTASLTN